MAYIKEYWDNKEERARQARKHTKEMAEKYSKEIEESVKNTRIYNPTFYCLDKKEGRKTEIKVIDADTVHAGKIYNGEGKVALLNFSSYKNAGGMFIKSSKAQEECLCHASYLYNVLSQFNDKFYDWNCSHKNRALYLNRGLYSPDIIFNGEFKCDVITCAAPNKSAAQKYQDISDEENREELKSRIRFVLDIAKDNNVDVLILGAYGCGVFGQNPKEVANIFKEYLNTTHKDLFSKVIFAIPDGKYGNFGAFKKVFGE